jgi:catechol 2,3-dioxygenase-like lactoylglutathione lyase family enzyme
MTSELIALCFDAQQPLRQAEFWSEVLGRKREGSALRPDDDTGFPIRFLATDEPKTTPNQMHFDLTSSSLADQQATVDRALRLGARHIDVGQTPEDGHVVLADPEGNEFCVIEPGNNFLAGCGTIGDVSCDGTREVGLFWSAALGWPLVWDQDEETAIQSPRGGTKLAWGGPPVEPRQGRDLHFAVLADGSGEIDRLLGLGAKRIDDHTLADPDDNKFSVLTRP